MDELAPPTRTFLAALETVVETIQRERKVTRERVRFTRREVREKLKWSEPQVRRHLDKLESLEYVACHRVPGTGARFVYELLYAAEPQSESFSLTRNGNGSSPLNGVRHSLVTESSFSHDAN